MKNFIENKFKEVISKKYGYCLDEQFLNNNGDIQRILKPQLKDLSEKFSELLIRLDYFYKVLLFIRYNTKYFDKYNIVNQYYLIELLNYTSGIKVKLSNRTSEFQNIIDRYENMS